VKLPGDAMELAQTLGNLFSKLNYTGIATEYQDLAIAKLLSPMHPLEVIFQLLTSESELTFHHKEWDVRPAQTPMGLSNAVEEFIYESAPLSLNGTPPTNGMVLLL
jgi:hypothetical protein